MALLGEPKITRGDRQRLPSWDDDDWFELTGDDDTPYDLTDRTVDIALVINRTNERIDLTNGVEVHPDPTTGQVAIILEESDASIPIEGHNEILYGQFRLEGGEKDPTTAGSFKLTVHPSRHNVEIGATLLPYAESFGAWAEDGVMDAEGARISNLSDPVSEQDAVNDRTLQSALGDVGGFDHSFTEAVDAQSNDLRNVGAFDAAGIDLSGSVADPMNYGAVGDGETDDSDAFQAACDAVAPEGVVIYHHDHQLDSPVNSKGADIISVGGTVYAAPDATTDQYRIGYESNDIALLYSDGTDDVTFSIDVDGRDQYVAGGALWHAAELKFINCDVRNCANSGLQFMGNRSAGDAPVSDSVMQGNRVEGCVWNFVVDGEAQTITIEGNRSRDANARHLSCDPGEAADNPNQDNISIGDLDCEGQRPTPSSWSDYPGPQGLDYAIRPLGGVDMRASDITVSDWGDVGLGTTASDVSLIVHGYTFRNPDGDSKGTALYAPAGPVTVIDTATVIRATDGVNLYAAANGSGYVNIRNVSFIEMGGGSIFNNSPDTLPSEWVISDNYNDAGAEVSP